nr:hypothetical protein Iba_chr08eCG2110 [Ipomoea batatas]
MQHLIQFQLGRNHGRRRKQKGGKTAVTSPENQLRHRRLASMQRQHQRPPPSVSSCDVNHPPPSCLQPRRKPVVPTSSSVS